ncbi:ABC transporter permease [Anoxynatronum sibiricum]|uniref:ABC transporter permease n=1 Tax=Anoxynatronum sibiricum TaxID=210623 RepID=A0ABU9VTH2_9CLOT
MPIRILQLYRDRSDFFWELFVQHVYITLIAVGIITVLGLVLGIAMTKNKWMAGLLLRLTSFLFTIPSIALFGVLVSITGIGLRSALIAIILYGLLPMIRNTYTGLIEVDPEIMEAAEGMGSTPGQLLLRIQLPLALPVIFSGFRTMVVMTIALGGIASFIGAGGLGRAIWRGISTNYAEMTIAGSLLIALFAIITDMMLEKVEQYLRTHYLGEGGKHEKTQLHHERVKT